MAAAAPPPPSPPPPPPTPHRAGPFALLPAELLEMILQYLGPEELVAFGLADYRNLLRHRIVQPLTMETYHRITRRTRSRNTNWLPVELQFDIMGYLQPGNIIALVLAGMFRYFPIPDVTQDLQQGLRSCVAEPVAEPMDGSGDQSGAGSGDGSGDGSGR